MSYLSRRSWFIVPLIACACGGSWRPVPVTPTGSRTLEGRNVVVLKGDQRVELVDVRVTQDSVFGIQDRQRRAIPRDSVTSIERKAGPSPVPIVMGLALLAAATVGILSAYSP